MWVTNGSERLLIAIDADTAKERWRVPVPAGPRRLAVDARGVWVGTSSPDGEPGLVLRYDRETGVQQQQVVVNEGVGAMASSGDALWIVKRDSNALSRLDPGAAQFRDIVSAPGPVRSMSFGAGALWLVLAGEDTIARYAMDGREPFTAGAGRNPTTALVAGDLLFVAARNDQSVQVLDTETPGAGAGPDPGRRQPDRARGERGRGGVGHVAGRQHRHPDRASLSARCASAARFSFWGRLVRP